MFSCFHKNPDTTVSPDANAKDSIKKKNVLDNDFSEDLNIELNMPEIIEDLRMDIKNLIFFFQESLRNQGLKQHNILLT